MDIKITQEQFDSNKFLGLTSNFKDLDVDNDNEITQNDLNKATDAKVKSDIQTVLGQVDEDEEVELSELNFDGLDELLNNANAAQNELSAQAERAMANKVIAGITIEGYTNVDTSNLEGKTSEELEEMINNINHNIALINSEIEKLENQNKEYDNEIKKLRDSNKALETQKKEWQDKIDEEQGVLSDQQEKITDAEKDLEVANNEFMLIRQHLDEVNENIIKEQQLAQRAYEEEIEATTERAIAQYNPEVDGEDFNKYLMKKLGDAGYVMFTKLNELNAQALGISNEAQGILSNISEKAKALYDARAGLKVIQDRISSYESHINPLNTQITDNNSKISDFENKKSTNNTAINSLNNEISKEVQKKTTVTTKLEEVKRVENYNAADILSKISDAEKKLALDNNVDLTKCFIAEGKDSNWHIYLNNGTSLARQYGNKGSKNYKGTDIISLGSGYVNNLKETDDERKNSKTIYRLTDVNEDLSNGIAETSYATYSTSSPLSFDVDGDGVHTSEEKIMYDIDGNGSLDNINNSAEWVLAFDKDGNGIAGENGSELFGDNTDLDGNGKKDGYANGFEALKALAKQEGLIGDGDSVLDKNDIAHLSEKFGLTMTKGYGGESKSLSDLGITQINLAETSDTTLTKNFDGRHNDIMTQEGATFVVNGETREYADIWNAKFETNNPDASLTLNKDKVITLQGKVDTEAIIENAKITASKSAHVTRKIEDYEKKKTAEEEEQEKKIAKQKEEEEIAEQKKLEEEKVEQEKINKEKNKKA